MPFPHLDVIDVWYRACQSEHPHLQVPGSSLNADAAATSSRHQQQQPIYAQLPSSALHQTSPLSFCNGQSHPHFTSWEAEAFEKELVRWGMSFIPHQITSGDTRTHSQSSMEL